MGLLGNGFTTNFSAHGAWGTVRAFSLGNRSKRQLFLQSYNKAGSATALSYNSNPTGGYPPATWQYARKAGEMSMRSFSTCTFDADLIPQQPTSIAMTGSGTLAATILGYGNIIAAITGSSSFTADINATGNIELSATGNGTLTATIRGDGYISIDFNGNGELTAEASLIKAMLIAMTGSGTLTSDASLFALMLADFTGGGSLSASITGQHPMSIDLTGTGDLDADITAFGNMILALTGSSSLTAAINAYADMSIDIVVTGTGLTLENVRSAVWRALAVDFDDPNTMGEIMNNIGAGADPWNTALPGAYAAGTAGDKLGNILSTIPPAVWAEPIEGAYTAEQVMKLLVSVAAGTSTIVDNGDGTATVTFRDINNTVTRITAAMDGSERITVTKNVT